MSPLFLLALLLLLVGIVAIIGSRRARSATGLPSGRVVYADTSRWQRAERPLFSRRHQLAGKPDYLVRENCARENRAIVPVEVKSSRAPAQGPREGHILQLAAYCLLVEETEGARPTFGIIKYADEAFRVDNTQELDRALLATLDAMRRDLAHGQAHRSHADPARCRRCGVRAACDERLDALAG
jgi:CRISPR-associated exonuclease Cas4